MISRSRLWVSSGYYNEDEILIKRPDNLDKKYSLLMRYVKNSTIHRNVNKVS